MAQAEDTELRDLVIEALERNGSLAKIRALLRANIFLAFEDECENIKQNINLDNILKLPEGILALSVVHEFLEFCCLKNTLFVYMSESRQGNEYSYEGKKTLAEKLNISKGDAIKEPILLTVIKNLMKAHRKSFDPNNTNIKNHDKCSEKNYRDEQNCTYILHEDSQSSNNSNSNSDNSSDEKNKLHLRLQLDNSDTDTSSDFARDKSSSEYIPGDHILEANNNDNVSNLTSQKSSDCVDARSLNNLVKQDKPERDISLSKHELKLTNSSSDSTSYIELKPFNSLDERMLNTAGLPLVGAELTQVSTRVSPEMSTHINLPSPKSATLSSISSVKEVENNVGSNEKKSQESAKSDPEIGDFSYGDDFSSSPKLKEVPVKQVKSIDSPHVLDKSPAKNSSIESPHQISQSSQSSVSLSDVADLISEKSSLSNPNNKSIQSSSHRSKDKVDIKSSRIYSDDSGDFTESPVPSLSNLSLDIHSD